MQSLAHVHCHIATYESPIHTVRCHTLRYMPPSPVTPSHSRGQSHKEVAPTVTRSHTRAHTVTHSHPCTVNLRHTSRPAVTQPHTVTSSLRAVPALTPVTNSRVGALTSRRPSALIGRSLIARRGLRFRVGNGQSRPVPSRER